MVIKKLITPYVMKIKEILFFCKQIFLGYLCNDYVTKKSVINRCEKKSVNSWNYSNEDLFFKSEDMRS